MTPAPRTELVVVTSVEREAAPFRRRGIPVVVAGVGRVNAAVATAVALGSRPMPGMIVNAGIAGALPVVGGEPLPNGTVVVGTRSIYMEEGLLSDDGFVPVADLGFPLATFAEGNAIPADPQALELVRERLPDARFGPIATVATCSGTDALAEEVVGRTGAIAEAMEGAAVLHAARLLGVASIEIRVVSNRCGRRDRQAWDLERAFAGLDEVAAALPSA